MIDFAIEFKGYGLNEALRELALMYGIEGDKKSLSQEYKTAPLPIKPKTREVGDLELPPKADNMKEVFHYLVKERKIDHSVVRYFAAKKMLFQDASHNNCVFVSHRFGCVRSTGGERFIADLNGCDYNECFFFRPSCAAKTLVVAESVIDVMSIMTWFAREDKRYTEYCYLALAGTNKLPSLFYHLQKETDISAVLLAFDNDMAGRSAMEAAVERLKEIGFSGDVEDFLPPFAKDWNEYIKETS